MGHAVEKQYSNEQVRERLLEFWGANYKPSWVVLSDEIGLTYTYVLDFKNGTKEIGQEALERIVKFLDEAEK